MKRYHGPGSGNDVPRGLVVDSVGEIYVTGYDFDGVNYDCVTIKYAIDGAILWVQHFESATGSAFGRDIAASIPMAPSAF